MEKAKLDRINALARKAKAIGLTDREKEEQTALRREYLAEIRQSVQSQLDNTYVQTADGAKIPYKTYVRRQKQAKAKKK